MNSGHNAIRGDLPTNHTERALRLDQYMLIGGLHGVAGVGSANLDPVAWWGVYNHMALGHVSQGRIWLTVNGELRQESDVKRMLWDVPHIIAELSTLYEVRPGDLVFCGTPAGVGAVRRGDALEGGVEGLEVLRITIASARESG